MSCGHAIGSESMTMLLKQTVNEKGYWVHCPGAKQFGNNARCKREWPYDLCQQVAILSRQERFEIEEGFSKNFAENSLNA